MEPREMLRLAYGLSQILFPGRAEQVITGVEPNARARLIFRVLGARQVIQAIGTRRSGARGHTLGAAIDVTHALSALAFAAHSERWRATARVSATISLLFAAGEVR